jgi:xanthine dehydrogenase accessory factor
MTAFFRILRRRLAEGEPLALAAIINAKGSTPRKTGALMLVDRKGRVAGTIGGAIMEYLAIEEAKRFINDGAGNLQKDYFLHPNAPYDIGAQCGGEITVMFTRLDPQDPHVDAVIDRIIAQHEKDRGVVYLFGGGHVGQETASLLTRLDFRCAVYDDRAEFADPALFEPGVETICHSFASIGDKITLTAADYCIILTHGHQSDYESYAFALQSPARYIGVIGSKRKMAFVEGRLKAAGFTETQIHAARVHAPIGLDIGSETPAEVAVSIAAQLIMLRAGRQPQ